MIGDEMSDLDYQLSKLEEEVRHLRAENEMLKLALAWVKCSEKLPEEPGVYLVYREDDPSVPAFVHPECRVTSRIYFGEGRWSSAAKVTHWRACPPYPKGAE